MGVVYQADHAHWWCVVALQAVRLQSFARRWLAQQRVGVLRMERDRRLAWQEEQQRRRTEEKKEQLRERLQRWSNPQRQEDFNDLYRSVASEEGSVCHVITDAILIRLN